MSPKTLRGLLDCGEPDLPVDEPVLLPKDTYREFGHATWWHARPGLPVDVLLLSDKL